MIDFGTVRPGTTLRIPFATYDSNDPSASVTASGLATTDIEVYKDGGTTARASDSGYALLGTDGIDEYGTGIHGISIDLADNTTAGFYAAGSQYHVVVASITVDAATVNFIAATFRIGYPDAVLNTTIATLASQTSFTLTSGPAEDDALKNAVVCIHDVASAVQLGFAVISAYTGATKTVTLTAGTTFTAAASDNIAIYPPVNTKWVGATAQTAGDIPALVTTVDGVVDDILTDTADMQPKLGSPAGASMSADIAAIKSDSGAILTDTAEIGAAGAGLTAVPWNAAWDAEVQSEVEDGLIAHGLDHLVGASVADTDVADNSIVAKLVDSTAITADFTNYDWTTDSLRAIRDQGDSAWITATGFSTHAAADVWSVATRVLTANTNLNDPTAAAIADAVWDEAIAGHAGVGSTGEQLAAAGAAGDPWATALPGAYGAGTAGKIVGDNLNAPVGTVDTVVDAIKAVTDNLPDSGALTTIGNNVAAILTDTGTDGVVVAAASKSGYVLAASGSAALTEGYASLGAAGTLPEILYEIRALLAEKSISSTTLTAKKLDGSTTAATYTLDDATTPSAITRAT